ncbi:Protein serine phosphatase with GAF(S) sensor(S) [Planctomycetales bacterium 10988]|nr:Protein serine phosphatase with GAF(S) sensor(S) [Planctomycetales bacterium 10988]
MEFLIDSAREDLPPEELRRRLISLSTLVEVTRDLAGEIDLEKILASIAREACRGIGCERATVFQYEEDSKELVSKAFNALEIPEIRIKLSQGITGHVARTRKLANITDPANDSRWNGTFDDQTGFQTESILAVPILSPDESRLLGVLEMLNKHGGPFDAYDEALIQAFAQHAAVAFHRARLIYEVRRRSAMEMSLNVAREIQRSFMPNHLPEIPGYEVATWWFPNEAVGGDYCDVISLSDSRTALIIADVSGHGLGPSLIMASVRAGLRALLLDHSAPEILLGLLGHSMADDLRDGRFITMVLAALDPKKHNVEFANAGHSPAIHYDASEKQFRSLDATGMPLGVLDRPEYPQGPPIYLECGDLVVLCTDGIVEAMDEREEQFGLERLQQMIGQHAESPIDQLVKKIGREVEAHFVGENPPDDLTILAIRRNK